MSNKEQELTQKIENLCKGIKTWGSNDRDLVAEAFKTLTAEVIKLRTRLATLEQATKGFQRTPRTEQDA